jgi:hypothetical protein
VTGLSVMTAASTAGDLLWEIEDAIGAVLASGTIEQPIASYDTIASSVGHLTWYDVTLASPVTFVAGSTYYLVVRWVSRGRGAMLGRCDRSACSPTTSPIRSPRARWSSGRRAW